MIPNCKGCEEEFYTACMYVEEGYHIATAIGREFSGKGHLAIMLVDDDGNLVIQ